MRASYARVTRRKKEPRSNRNIYYIYFGFGVALNAMVCIDIVILI